MATSDVDLEAEIDRLYQRPLAEFTEARNALAATVRSRGDKAGAARVKALARASVSAWATNQVYWTARPEFDAFLDSSRRLQSAQAEGAGGAELREAMQKRREAQAAVMKRAESLLVDAGHGANPNTLRRVSESLHALAAENVRPGGVRPGRLVHDLDPPGFDAFAGPVAISRVSAATTTGGPAEAAAVGRGAESRALEQARNALAEAEGRLERATREAREAEDTLSAAEKRTEAARVELDQAGERLERARERAASAAADEAAARLEAGRLASARDVAEAARDAAARATRAPE